MTGPFVRVPASTGWVELAGVVYAARLPDGPPLVLGGPAALVWDAVCAGGSLADVVDRVASASGESAADVRPGVEGFVSGLVDAGVVVLGATGEDS
jgi:hypothetical protein